MLVSTDVLEGRLATYEELLLKWSASLNLVSKNTLNDIRRRHFADSLQLTPFLKPEDSVIDIGAGAGFPGMVLAMAGFNLTLVESDQKKCVFLENVSRETQTPVKIVCDRIENFVTEDKTFDVVCSRGVASLSTLISWSTHLVEKEKSKGLFLKGENVVSELKEISSDKFSKIESVSNPGSYIIQYQY
ncbi:MAG: 16S rRNA (guanine(527)-N(7))-methyltransferase RsmG [Candidatus Paracaedibacteraceae bacterium]|nr:16S rRNA (guanine(527)-N(7))-methyltransferase RsmG [Candidatus Paracaedibacteraceae bacterium]